MPIYWFIYQYGRYLSDYQVGTFAWCHRLHNYTMNRYCSSYKWCHWFMQWFGVVRKRATLNCPSQCWTTPYDVTRPRRVNTLRPIQNGRHFADDTFKCTFLNENVWIPIEISLKFVPKGSISNNPALFQIMAWCRPGDKPLSEPMMVSSLTHICVTRPQWVKNTQFHWIYQIHKPSQCICPIAHNASFRTEMSHFCSGWCIYEMWDGCMGLLPDT